MKLKKFKRNAVLLTVVAFVCVAIYLNWSYNNKAAERESGLDAAAVDSMANQAEEEDEGKLFYSSQTAEGQAESSLNSRAAEYFASARLTREQSRSSALEMLRETAESQTAGADAQSQAVEAMAQLSDKALKESELENILIAKGFADCVVYMDETDISVIVPAEATGLSESDVARITEVVLSETAMTADQLKIIEVK